MNSENNITRQQYKKAIEQRRIFIVGTKYSRNGWTEFDVYEIRKNNLIRITVPNAGYYNKKNYNYKCTAWGTSRALEIFLAIGYELGLSFSDMSPQVSSIIN